MPPVTPALEPLRRIAAYAVATDPQGRVLLVRASTRSGTPGVWSLPGGAVDHGEDPNHTVVRETAAETGLSVAVTGLRDVLADMRSLPHRGVTIHTDRLIYEVSIRGGTIFDRIGQPTDLARWHTLEEAERLRLRPFTAAALGLSAASVDLRPEEVPDFPSFYAVAGPDGLHRAQRFAAYAIATDHFDNLLLTRIAPGYPGAGLWHLPGGGTDHGETPEEALARELVEETAQVGQVTGLLQISHRYDPAALGPEGVPIDWHVVRVLFRVQVEAPTEPVVTEAAGGSTEAAGWFSPEQAEKLPLTEIARSATRRLATERTRR
jgi:8-oxo-dGTP diphosphatase